MIRNRHSHAILLALIIAAVYVPLILQQADFRTDDYYLLTLLKEHGLPSPFDGQRYPFFSAFRIVPMFTLLVDHAIHGTNALGYYFFNLAVHIAAVLLFFRILRLLFRVFFGHEGVLLPFLLALAMGVHADLFYDVVWICNRTEGLLLLFSLAAVHAWLRYFEGGRLLWYLLGLVSMLLALLSKEQAMHLPLLFLLIGGVFVRSGKTGHSTRALLIGALPIAAAAAAFVMLRMVYDPGASFIAGFFSAKKAFSLVGINLIAFHPTLAKPLFIYFVEHRLIAALLGGILIIGSIAGLMKASRRTRHIVLVLVLVLAFTAFPRVLYHVFPRINSIQVVVLLLAIGVVLLHLRPRLRITLVALLLAAQLSGMFYELHYWRIETDNGRYAELLREEREKGPSHYRLLTYYHFLAPYTMHFMRTGDFGYDSSMQRTPLYIDRRYGSHRGPEFDIVRNGSRYEFHSTDPRSVFLVDTTVTTPRGMEIKLTEPAADYGFYRASIGIPAPEPNTLYLIERNIDFERLPGIGR
jgi:hypothetical protein